MPPLHLDRRLLAETVPFRRLCRKAWMIRTFDGNGTVGDYLLWIPVIVLGIVFLRAVASWNAPLPPTDAPSETAERIGRGLARFVRRK